MPDYQKMYHTLFNDVTDAITKLQQAQQKTEEMYISSAEPVITPLENAPKTDTPGPNKSRNHKKPPFRNER